MRVALASVILAAGCTVVACAKPRTTALSPEGAHVRVSDNSAVGGCEYVGDFVGGGGFGIKPGIGGWWEANQVRNFAAERGATDVVFDTEARGHLVGRGYRCP
jgi:hypothetical protein